VARVPDQFVMFMAMARMKNDADEFVSRQVLHVAGRPEDLPSAQQLETEVKEMIAGLEQAEQAAKFTDEYTGPVLLMGEAVSSYLTGALLSQREGLMATDNIPRLKGYQYSDPETALDTKIGKVITGTNITVKAKPTLKTYNGVSLLGSYQIDSEGVVPPDELTLIDKGVLKALMNNRTITHPSQTANGFASGPGVLEITFNSSDTEKILKEKLIKKAKEEGLEYAIIVREGGQTGAFGPQSVYKVSVADGSETRVRNARLGLSNLKALRKVAGASADYFVDNRASLRMEQPLSVIAPACLLVEEMDISSFRTPSLIQDEYVPNPLLKNN
ncbi:MAG TPA: metallopeptidase TldD-related protein, partial [Cyclobacteriaceae bacterium]|nr:metallopeptidase TldD-related protein [Cyclobacteriaceae bacterium]